MPVGAAILRRAMQLFHILAERFEPPVRTHLSDVYKVLVFTTMTTFLSVLFYDPDEIVMVKVMALSVCYYYFWGQESLRVMVLSFSSGQALARRVRYSSDMNEMLPVRGFIVTVVSYTLLTLGALLGDPRLNRSRGLMLKDLMSFGILLSLINIISQLMFLKLMGTCLFVFVLAITVVYKTQDIIEKHRAGERNKFKHALELGVTLFHLFLGLLIAATDKLEREYGSEDAQNDWTIYYFNDLIHWIMFCFSYVFLL